MARRLGWLLGLFAGGVTACDGPRHANWELASYDPKSGYRFDALTPGEGNTDSLFICLTFSGGGTRAAAFAYGVLLGLRDTQVPVQHRTTETQTLIEEVDLISAVSGGSFTAMGYALWHNDLFDGRFKNRFLTHNVQLDILLSFLTPKYMLQAPFVVLDSIDMAGFYYDAEIYDGATYGDLLRQDRRPFVVVNATDVTRRRRFEFTQDDFDLLGSDLATVPIGSAVAASSAFPLLLSPMRLKYFHGDPMLRAVRATLQDGKGVEEGRRKYWAKSLLADGAGSDTSGSIVDENQHRYLYLLDGGLADNLGLRYVIESYRQGAIRRKIGDGSIERLVVIIVDAATDPPRDLESRPSAPNLFDIGAVVGTTGMYAHSQALTDAIKYLLLEAPHTTLRVHQQCEDVLRENCPDAEPLDVPPESRIDSYVIDLNFRQMKDAEKRKSLLSTVSSLFLPWQEVNQLIDAGRRLIKDHPEFQRLMRDLDQSMHPTGG